MQKISLGKTSELIEASEVITEAMSETTIPDALDFAWWSDEKLMSYFKNGEWYELPMESKSDLYEVLQMRGLL